MKKLTRENAKEVFDGFLDLDDCIKILEMYKKQGKSVFVKFNEHKLYSCDITVDSAYKEVTGKTYAEVQDERKKWMEKFKKEEEDAIAKIPYWKEEGKKYIASDKHALWEECVEIRAKDLYHGIELDAFLDVAKLLQDHDFDKAYKLIDSQNHSNSSYGIMMSMIKTFAPNGKEYIDYSRNEEAEMM